MTAVSSSSSSGTSITPAPPLPPYRAINWIGMGTLYRREVHRFLKVFWQTLAAPVVTVLLFFMVFAVAWGDRVMPGALNFTTFLVPGLVMMNIIQNAFANPSSSIMIGKIQGVLTDILVAPLSAAEMTAAYLASGVTRGLIVGLVTLSVIAMLSPVSVPHPVFALVIATLAGVMLAGLGVITGLWAEKFDHMAAVTNFILTPASFLSGTFYSIRQLPPVWQDIALYNPLFYTIDAFRYGITGYSDTDPAKALVITALTAIITTVAVYILLLRRYKISQ
ncbi:MAG: ABC transporter permease [Pseudomonadota bacterium]